MKLRSKRILACSIAGCFSLSMLVAAPRGGIGLSGGMTGSTGVGAAGPGSGTVGLNGQFDQTMRPGQTLSDTSAQGNADVNGTSVNTDTNTVKKNAQSKVRITRNTVNNRVNSTQTQARNLANNAKSRVVRDYNADVSVSGNAGSSSANGNVKASSTKSKNQSRNTSTSTGADGGVQR